MPKTASFYWVLGFAAFTFACQPDIGDACQLHSQCSQTGARICEPNFPGGYCTIFNCEPGTCPSEAVCVAYDTRPSSNLACADPTENRFERRFCMKNCTGNGDCRDGYECVNLQDSNNSLTAVVVEHGSYNARVCTVALPPSRANQSTDPEDAVTVCSPPPAVGFPPPPVAGQDAGASDGGGSADASITDGGLPLLPDGAAKDARGGT